MTQEIMVDDVEIDLLSIDIGIIVERHCEVNLETRANIDDFLDMPIMRVVCCSVKIAVPIMASLTKK